MEFHVKADYVAKVLNLTTRRINQLIREGVLEKDNTGKLDLRNVIPAYIEFVSENDSAELKREKILHERAKREKAELELRLRKNELHESKDVEEIMIDMITRAKTKLLGIPSKVAPLVLGYKDISKVQSILQNHVEEALNELADYNPELFASDKADLPND